jgi:hypothetical protein
MPPPGPSAAGLSKDAKDAESLRHEAVIDIAEMFVGGVAGILRDAARMACESDAMQDDSLAGKITAELLPAAPTGSVSLVNVVIGHTVNERAVLTVPGCSLYVTRNSILLICFSGSSLWEIEMERAGMRCRRVRVVD